jgi:hypothetical protein
LTSYPLLCRLPLTAGKKRPMLVNWSSLAPDDDIITKVFAENPNCGTGLRLDQFVVIDCDTPERVAWWLEQGFPTEFMSRGNPERRSFWYRLPEDVELRTRRFPDFEIRTGPGCQCVVPPSIHPGGWRYEWLGPAVTQESFWDIPEAPVAFLESLHVERERPVGDGAGWDVVLEGEGRDNFLTSIAGLLRAKGASVAAVRAGISAMNHVFCEPRMSSGDLDRISRSSGRWESTGFTFMDEDGDQYVAPRRKGRR